MKEEFYVQIRYRKIDPWENRWSMWVISPDSYEKTIEELKERFKEEPEVQVAKFYYTDEKMTQFAGWYHGVMIRRGKIYPIEDK